MILIRSNIYTLSHAPSLSHSQKPNATTLLIGWLLGCAAEFAIVSGFLYIFLKLIYLNGATFFELFFLFFACSPRFESTYFTILFASFLTSQHLRRLSWLLLFCSAPLEKCFNLTFLPSWNVIFHIKDDVCGGLKSEVRTLCKIHLLWGNCLKSWETIGQKWGDFNFH